MSCHIGNDRFDDQKERLFRLRKEGTLAQCRLEPQQYSENDSRFYALPEKDNVFSGEVSSNINQINRTKSGQINGMKKTNRDSINPTPIFST